MKEIEELREANAKLSLAVDKLTWAPEQPEKAVLKHDFGNGTEMDVELWKGTWVSTAVGTRLILLDVAPHCQRCPLSKDGACSCTRVLVECDHPVTLPPHKHEQGETVTVVHGFLKDQGWGKFGPGQKITYPAGSIHSPEFYGMLLVCFSPPLQAGKPEDTLVIP